MGRCKMRIEKTKTRNDEIENIYELDEPIANYRNFRVSVYYSKGGYNYYTGDSKPRGFYLSAQPLNVHYFANGGWTIESVLMGEFMSTSVFLEEAKRLSSKRLNELNAQHNKDDSQMVKDLLNYFQSKEKK